MKSRGKAQAVEHLPISMKPWTQTPVLPKKYFQSDVIAVLITITIAKDAELSLVPMSGWIQKWNMVHISLNKGRNSVICDNINGIAEYYAKWKKSNVLIVSDECSHLYVKPETTELIVIVVTSGWGGEDEDMIGKVLCI
jgi:chromosome condensin MukBEF MukE localization factor